MPGLIHERGLQPSLGYMPGACLAQHFQLTLNLLLTFSQESYSDIIAFSYYEALFLKTLENTGNKHKTKVSYNPTILVALFWIKLFVFVICMYYIIKFIFHIHKKQNCVY